MEDYISEVPFSMAMNEPTVASEMSQGETTVKTGIPLSFDYPSLVCHGHPWSRIDEHVIPPVSRTSACSFRVERQENSEGVCTGTSDV
jgi:hypothetical protein